MAEDFDNLNGVICYWQYNEKEKYNKWQLVESFGIDSDGWVVTNPYPSTGGDKHGWMDWLNKPAGKDEDGEDDGDDRECIMSRAVTIWSVESGVRLLGFHPPAWAEWLSVEFYEKLRELPNWSSFLDGGYNLYLGTARAVEKIIYGR